MKLSSKVGISEGTVFRIFWVTWFICFLIGGLFVFPFGFVFMGIFGFFIALIVVLIYVNSMSMLFGERSGIDGGGSRFNFLSGRFKRDGDDDELGSKKFGLFRRKR